MAEDSKVEIEDIIEDLDCSTPSCSRSSSLTLDRGSYLQSPFQDPTSIPDRLQWMEAVDSFAPIPRSDLRSTKLAEDNVPWTVAVTYFLLVTFSGKYHFLLSNTFYFVTFARKHVVTEVETCKLFKFCE